MKRIEDRVGQVWQLKSSGTTILITKLPDELGNHTFVYLDTLIDGCLIAEPHLSGAWRRVT